MKNAPNRLTTKFKQCLIPALTLALLTATSQATTIAWWRGDLSGSTLVSNTGTYNGTSGSGISSSDVAGSAIYDPVSGLYYSNTAAFLGSNMQVANSLKSTLQGDFTIEAIVKLTTNDGYQTFFGNSGDTGTYTAFHLGILGWNYDVTPILSSQRVYGGSVDNPTGYYNVTSGKTQPFGEYFSLALTGVQSGSDTVVNMFVNGDLINSTTFTGGIYFTNDPFTIASSWGGLIDELRISDVELTPDEFLQIAAIPEPNAASLLLGGIGIAFVIQKLRRRQTIA